MIWNFISESERDLFGFKEAALSAFDFLTNNYGFICVKIKTNFLRYESKLIFVEVYFNSHTGELEVILGSLSGHINKKEKFYLYELIHSEDKNVSTAFPMFAVYNREQMRQSSKQLANLLKKYGEDLLKGNMNKFNQLKKWRQLESKILTSKMQFGNYRTKADVAWQEKDYAKVVKLYEAIKEDLILIELKRLEYAKKQIKIK